jgi:hypothetical protein
VKKNFRSGATGSPPDGPPKKNTASFGSPHDWHDDINNYDNIEILRSAINEALESLGGPIHKTITWHMNNRGIFADSRIDVDSYYSNLKELVGPGADLIMEETWHNLQKRKFPRK